MNSTRQYIRLRDKYDALSDDELLAQYYSLTARLKRRNLYVTFWTGVVLVFVCSGFSDKFGSWISNGALLLSRHSNSEIKHLGDLTAKQLAVVNFFNLPLVILSVLLVSGFFLLYLYVTSRLHYELLIITSIKDKRKS